MCISIVIWLRLANVTAHPRPLTPAIAAVGCSRVLCGPLSVGVDGPRHFRDFGSYVELYFKGLASVAK
jgi:hypothetical protein